MRFVPFIVFVVCLAAAACGTAVGTGGSGSSSSSSDATSKADTAAASGDKTKNSAAVQAKAGDGATTDVKPSKAASKDDQKTLGVMNADKQLQLFISDGKVTIVAYINTEKWPLPATGIKVGAVNSDCWVSYTDSTGIYNSTDTGTIDISACPWDATDTVTVGQFNGVVVDPVAAMGTPKPITLSGSFNLVYFGGAGVPNCTKPKVVDTTPADAGSTGNSKLKKGNTCAFTECDGNINEKRNCCKYFPCMEPCGLACGEELSKCTQACSPTDPACQGGCFGAIGPCVEKCYTTCGVDATCKAALQAVQTCDNEKGADCKSGDSAKDDACKVDACCAEYKAAF